MTGGIAGNRPTGASIGGPYLRRMIFFRRMLVSLLALIFFPLAASSSHARHRGQRRRPTWSFSHDQFQHEAPNRVVEYADHPWEERRQRRQEQEVEKLTLDYANAAGYQPIRIAFDTEPLLRQKGANATINQEIDYLIKTVLPQAAARWAQYLYVIPVQSTLLLQGPECYGVYGSLNQKTIADADLVVLVGGSDNINDGQSSVDVCDGSTLAVSGACSLDQYDRPILGFMNFCLGYQTSADSFTAVLQQNYASWTGAGFSDQPLTNDPVEITVHEMGHILGDASWLFKYFRDAQGQPRTPRPFQRRLANCANGTQEYGIFPSEDVVQSTLLASGRTVQVLATPAVRQVARNQFDCQAMPGARLEEHNGCIGTHWHERDYYNELLGPEYSSSSGNILTALTLALFDDSGWYQVNYRGIGIAAWGLGAGCSFVSQDCVMDDQVPAWGRDHFCTAPFNLGDGAIAQETLDSVFCDPNHKTWVLCDLFNESTFASPVVPTSAPRLFSDPNLVSLTDLIDYCPILDIALGLDCTVSSSNYTSLYNGEAVGPNSRCINGYFTYLGAQSFQPACMPITCDKNSGKVLIGTGAKQQTCTEDYEVLNVGSAFSDGYLICPRLATVCPELYSCPASCSGHGICRYQGLSPYCECYANATQNEGCYPALPPRPSPSPLPGSSNNMPTPSSGGGGSTPTVTSPTTSTSSARRKFSPGALLLVLTGLAYPYLVNLVA